MRGSVLKAAAMVGFSEKAALEQGPEGGERAGRVGMMGREIQAEGTAGAQRQWWECLWPAPRNVREASGAGVEGAKGGP